MLPSRYVERKDGLIAQILKKCVSNTRGRTSKLYVIMRILIAMVITKLNWYNCINLTKKIANWFYITKYFSFWYHYNFIYQRLTKEKLKKIKIALQYYNNLFFFQIPWCKIGVVLLIELLNICFLLLFKYFEIIYTYTHV